MRETHRHASAHKHIKACIFTFMRDKVRVCGNTTLQHTHTQTDRHTQTHTDTQTHRHTHTPTHRHEQPHRRTEQTQADIHTHTRISTCHMHMHSQACSPLGSLDGHCIEVRLCTFGRSPTSTVMEACPLTFFRRHVPSTFRASVMEACPLTTFKARLVRFALPVWNLEISAT